MDDKYERWLLKAVNEVLRTTRDCAKRLGDVEERLEGLEAGRGRAGAPGPEPVADDEPALEPDPVEETDTPAPMPAAAAAAVAAGGEEYIEVANDAELAAMARASRSTKVLAQDRDAGPAGPPEVDEPPEAVEKSEEELRAAFKEDPGHCPQCGVRLKKKAKECRKCGLVLPKGGSALKKVLVAVLVLLLLLAGTGATLHFTGNLPGVLGKIPWVKDNIPACLAPTTESGPPTTETGPPTTETAAPEKF